MASYEEPVWTARNRSSMSSLKAQLVIDNNLADSIMAASATKSSLTSNPWDAPAGIDALEVPNVSLHMTDLAASTTIAPISHVPARPPIPPSLFDQPSLLDNTRPLHPTPSSVSLSHHASNASLDYISPTEAAHNSEPEPDPWSATIPKLDVALGGHEAGGEGHMVRGDGKGEGVRRGSVGNKKIGEAVMTRDLDYDVPTMPDIPQLEVERIKVTIAPEKGGLVWKHVNYVLQCQTRRSSVLRRYSDFLWLLDVLVRRYPFRIIPSLPPKKVGADDSFLERRRRALSRFINMVANHPVMREDESVIAFLTVEMDIQSFRKKASISYDEESVDLKITLEELTKIPRDLADRITQFKTNLDFLICQFRDLATLMERIARREDGTALDFMRYSLILNKLTEKPDCTDPECYNCPRINNGYNQMSGGLQRVSRLMEEEGHSTFDGIIESLKTHRDLLIACQEFFYREERALSAITLDALTKRIATNETKLRDVQTKGGGKEADRLAAVIETDKKEVESQRQRIDYIRYCTWEELKYYHKQKAFISLMYQQYVSEKMRFSSHFSEIWRTLSTSVFELPTSEYA